MDLSIGFDILNDKHLIAKLYAYGFSKDALKFIYSYMTNRWQISKINESFRS